MAQENKFPLGRLVMTPHLRDTLRESNPGGWPYQLTDMIGRHARGDWGEALPPEDRKANDRALAEGGRLLSAYKTKAGIEVWSITEQDRSATTCLLPEDY